MNDEIIVITAAGVGTWMREKFTPWGISRMLGESFIPEYEQKMEIVRQVDDRIYEWSKDLGIYIDMMEDALKSKRLVDLASLALSINKTLKSVSVFKDKILPVSEKSVKDFEKERSPDAPTWKKLKELSLRDPEYLYFSPEQIRQQMSTANNKENLLKQAFIFDWLDDKKREWISNKLQTDEKRKREADLRSFFSFSRSIINQVRNLIKKLHKHRAYGEIGKYSSVLQEISNLQNKFENDPELGFRVIFKKHLEPLIQKTVSNVNSPGDNSAPAAASTAAPAPGQAPGQAPSSIFSSGWKFLKGFAGENEYKQITEKDIKQDSKNLKEEDLGKCNCGSNIGYGICHGVDKKLLNSVKEELFPDKKLTELKDLEKQEIENNNKGYLIRWMNKQTALTPRYATALNYKNFIIRLANCSNQYEAANLMLKYSQDIEEYDLEKSLKLLALAEGLLND